MIPREQHMNTIPRDGTEQEREAHHRAYFAQFVLPGTISRVVQAIGKDKILASKDPHMNDIPLPLWDRLVAYLPGSHLFKEAGDYYTLANGVCLAKEAARQWKEAQMKEDV